MKSRWILGLSAMAILTRGLMACGDDSTGTSTDGGGGSDATAGDASQGDDGSAGGDGNVGDGGSGDGSQGDGGTADASDASDAGPDAMGSVLGIWKGVQGGYYGSAWSILIGLVPGAENAPPGATVGVVTYPSLGCGGPLTVIGPDAGVPFDGGLVDDRDGGDAGVVARLVLHEDDDPGCVDGTDYFTLLSDGTLRAEWTDGSEHDLGSLTRVGTAGGVPPLTGVWAEPSAPFDGGMHPLLAAVTRTDTNGASAGVFLLRGAGTQGCGGFWTQTQGAGTTSLTFNESFPEGQVGCLGLYAPTFAALSDGGVLYTRTTSLDAGADADASADGATGPYTLGRVSP